MAAKTKRTRPNRTDSQTLILTLSNGDLRKLTIPGDWTFTYGSLVPPSRDNRMSDGKFLPALRLYGPSGKNDLRAVFTDVKMIRDSSIIIQERRTSVKRQMSQRETPKGMKDVVVEARMTEWVNPDDEDDDNSGFLALTSTIDTENE